MAEMLTLPPGVPPRRSYFIPALLFALAAIVVGGSWFLAAGEPRITSEAASDEALRLAIASELVSVSSQPAGSSVMVERVNVDAPAVWVVVAEMRGDVVWRALGAFHTLGTSNSVPVPLLRATAPQSEYAIILYRDDGDGQFELHGDSAFIDFETGARVRKDFKTL